MEQANLTNYQCGFCGRKEVKLWCPYSLSEPLICAICAEKRQSFITYVVRDSKNVPLRKEKVPHWHVDEKGRVPAYSFPTSGDVVDNLIVNVHDVGGSYRQAMFPAVVDENGEFYPYHQIPESEYSKWENLPTR